MRTYLQNGDDGVRNLISIAPPNHGMTVLGDLAFLVAKAKDALRLPISKVGDIPLQGPEVTRTLGAFRSDIGIAGLRWNPQVAELNQPERVETENAALNSNSILAGTGHSHFGILLNGDEMVTQKSALRNDTQNFLFEGDRATHGRMHAHPEAMEKMVELLLNDGKARPTQVSPSIWNKLRTATNVALQMASQMAPVLV